MFFSGPALKLNISPKGNNANSYICYKKNDRHFYLVHVKDASMLTKEYVMAIPLDRFLSLIISNTTSIKAQLRKVISDSLKKSREQFEAEEKKGLCEYSNNKLLSWLSYIGTGDTYFIISF